MARPRRAHHNATLKMAHIDWNALYAVAEAARVRAHAPYSNFRVGAAVLTDDGIVGGCNVENASYGLCQCAERNALAQVTLLGKRPVAVAIVVDSKHPTPPCGACRQVMAELCPPNTPVRSRTVRFARESKSTVKALLPGAFSGDFLATTTKAPP